MLPPPPAPLDACGARSPSRSQSAVSRLPALRPRAHRALAQALGRNPQADAASTTNAGAAAPSASSSAPLYDLGPTTFAQINHASLSIDASWSDLLMAFRCAIGATEGPAERRRLQSEIAELFRSRPNVYDTPAEVAAGRERASRPPLAASASHMGGGEAAAAASYAAMAAASVAAASSASASPALPLASLVNANSSLPAAFIAPAYLRSEHNILTALSARSCLDQWLTSKAFAPGSHVLLTAINIPDISVVLRAHKLVPVPVDIQLDTLAPNMERLEAACKAGTDPSRTEGRVVAILVAQLYGRRCDMDPIVAVAQRYSLQLIEDLAETFSGLDAIGHPQADLAFLSFGSIKVATAFGGGVCRVRDQSTWSDMRQRQDSWSTQTRHTFFMKCVKNTFAILALNFPLITGGLIRSGRTFNWDVKASVVAMMRGFPDRLMERLREQPSAALLSMIRYRLGNLDPTRFQEHQDKCDVSGTHTGTNKRDRCLANPHSPALLCARLCSRCVCV